MLAAATLDADAALGFVFPASIWTPERGSDLAQVGIRTEPELAKEFQSPAQGQLVFDLLRLQCGSVCNSIRDAFAVRQ